tara:strand:- start:62295 stop:63401 length:1107 start_codon:yes stop_codon:yes gene_type:complete
MSLPPVQSPLPELRKKTPTVKPPEPIENKADRDFKGSLHEARRAAKDAAHEATEAKKDANEANKAAEEKSAQTASGGNDLPEEEQVEGQAAPATTSTDLAETATNTLILQLGGEALAPAEADQAVLLAAKFVVENIPKTLQAATADLGTMSSQSNKPEVLARLQSFIAQTTGNLQPTRGVADSMSIESFESTALKELGKVSTQTSTSTNDTTNAQSAAAEARAIATPIKTELVIPQRVGSTDWGEAMAGRITLMVNQTISTARIHINPPELGPIEVKVNLNHDQASVQFTSQSAQVREALEQSVPKLREMLETAGFSLADSGVSDQGQEGFTQSDGGPDSGAEDTGLEDESISRTEVRQSIGLVDDYV